MNLESHEIKDITTLCSHFLIYLLTFSGLLPWGTHFCDRDCDQQHREDSKED